MVKKMKHSKHDGMKDTHQGPHHMDKEDHMSHKGVKQGDMNPVVDDYSHPHAVFSQAGFSDTTGYIERHNRDEKAAAKDIEKQGYVGRYS